MTFSTVVIIDQDQSRLSEIHGLMALADRTRQSGNATTRWPITVLFSNGSVLEPLDWPPRCRVAALPRLVCQSHNMQREQERDLTRSSTVTYDQ